MGYFVDKDNQNDILYSEWLNEVTSAVNDELWS